MSYYLLIFSAIALDFMFGDPDWMPHPVRAIGRLCEWSENTIRSICKNLYLAGFITVFLVISTTVTFVFLTVFTASDLSPYFGDVVAVLLLYTTIAGRDLLHHSKAVFLQLQPGGTLIKARKAIGRIVGRDTDQLDEKGIIRACVETVAENMVDGITAPLFFAIIASFASPYINMAPIECSVLGAFFYKAVNTMDSMIGYKNEKYLQFGRVAAKLDDIANYIPARLSGLCVILAAFFMKLDYRESARIYRRDRLRHASPNAGHTEAAVAGALGLLLGGPSCYFGKIVEKPYLGDGRREPIPEDITMANKLVLVSSAIFVSGMLGVRFLMV